MNIFEMATINKYRYDTPAGKVTTEDLWDLPLTSGFQNKPNLDSIAINISKQLKESSEESFVLKKTKQNETLGTMLEVVKHVIAFKLAENEQKAKSKELKAQKAKIRSIIEKKQDENLENMSLEDLTKMENNLK